MRLRSVLCALLVVGCGSSDRLKPVTGEAARDPVPDVEQVEGAGPFVPILRPEHKRPGLRPPRVTRGWRELPFDLPGMDNFGLQALQVRDREVLVVATTLSFQGDHERSGVHAYLSDGSVLKELGTGWALPADVFPQMPTVGFDVEGRPLVAWGEADGVRVYRWTDDHWAEHAAPDHAKSVTCAQLVTERDRVVLAWREGTGEGAQLKVYELDDASDAFSPIATGALEAGHEYWSCPSVSLVGRRTFVAWDENDEPGNSTVTPRGRVYVAEAKEGGLTLLAPPLGVEGTTPNGELCRLNWYPKLAVTSDGAAAVVWKSCAGIHSASPDAAATVTTIEGNDENPFPLRMLRDEEGREVLIARTDGLPTAFALRHEPDGTWLKLPIGTVAGFYGSSAGQVADFDGTGALVIIDGRARLKRLELMQ